MSKLTAKFLVLVCCLAVGAWFMSPTVQASVCFLPDGGCDLGNTGGIGEGGNGGGKDCPDGYSKMDTCASGYKRVVSEEVTGCYKCACGDEYNLSAEKDKNCWECSSCEDSSGTKYSCRVIEPLIGYQIVNGECINPDPNPDPDPDSDKCDSDNNLERFSDYRECYDSGCDDGRDCDCILDEATKCYIPAGRVLVVLHYNYLDDRCREQGSRHYNKPIHSYGIWMETNVPAPEDIVAYLDYASDKHETITIKQGQHKSNESNVSGFCQEYEDIHNGGGYGYDTYYDYELRAEEIYFNFSECDYNVGCGGQIFEHNGNRYKVEIKVKNTRKP